MIDIISILFIDLLLILALFYKKKISFILCSLRYANSTALKKYVDLKKKIFMLSKFLPIRTKKKKKKKKKKEKERKKERRRRKKRREMCVLFRNLNILNIDI